jgi:hypothetical protein
MAGIKTDESGQWLLLAAMIVAVGLAVLIVFVNQSLLAGHSSAGSIMDFPKNDIREFRSEAVNEAYLLGTEANSQGTSLTDRQSRFENMFDRFTADISYIYSTKGSTVSVKYNESLNYSILPGGQSIDNIGLILNYNNGDTQYNETTTVYLK